MVYMSRWKIWFIILVCLWGVIYALPNILSAETRATLHNILPAETINLGLDLQGGSHLLLEVKTNDVIEESLYNFTDVIRQTLRDENIGYKNLRANKSIIGFELRDLAHLDQALELLREQAGVDALITIDENGNGRLRLRETYIAERKKLAVDQSIEVVRRRVDETGTREPSIQRQGEDRILLQLPGIDDPERIKTLLGKTAKLTFHLVDLNTSMADVQAGRIPPGSMVLPSDERTGGVQAIRKQAVITGDMLVDSQPTFDGAEPVVSFRFDSRGARKFAEVTQENVGKPFAIVLDGKIISAPVIRQAILGGSGMISGSFTTESARDLALLLRAGALPAPLNILEERTVGPGLGQDSIEAGKIATMVGVVLVLVYMIASYGLFGIFAVCALVINIILLIAALSMFQATLTLPGIAGIVLTMGMAVDANVLIFERMREEITAGRSAISSVDAGYRGAFSTIIDSNLTSLISTILLYSFGTGPVRGFAVTLSIGIIMSMFTAILVTRLLIVTWLRRCKPDTLPI